MIKAFLSLNMKTRKRVCCAWCGGWIEVGDYYSASRNLYGKDEVFHWHPECFHAAQRELNAGYSREFHICEHARGQTLEEMERAPTTEPGRGKFRKKPVIVEAVRWTGDNLQEVISFTGRHPSTQDWTWEHFESVVKQEGLKIFTLSGPVFPEVGDWILRGVKGEVYPCQPDIFAETYEAVAEGE
jgi:hypothetical protein